MLGKYERQDNFPSVEVIVKLAKVLDVLVDFLLGEGANASFDKDTLKRLDDMETLPQEEK